MVGTLWCVVCDKDRGEHMACPECGERTIAVDFPTDPCAECQNKRALMPGQANTYDVSDDRLGSLSLNVDMARELARSRAPRSLLDRDTLLQILQVNRVTLNHLAHIPIEKFAEPGLLVQIELPTMTTIVLVDGSHRALQAVLDRRPYLVQLLPWSLARLCVLSFTPAGVTTHE